MVRRLIEWALNNPLVVILICLAMAVVGIFSFLNVNVEAYPDPAPAIVEVFAQFPGASAEEVERQVTIPLEVTFAGMPGLKSIHSKSLFGLSDLKMNWNYGGRWTYEAGRQEVINRLATISQPLPNGVTPQISPESPTGEIYRYVLNSPKDATRPRDLHAQRSQGAAGLGAGARVPHRAADRRRQQLGRARSDATKFSPIPIACAATASRWPNCRRRSPTAMPPSGGDYVNQGQVAMTVRSVGLFGGGADPVTKVLGEKNPVAAAAMLRDEERRRIRDMRSLVIASVNNQPVRVEDVVEGGRASPGETADRWASSSAIRRGWGASAIGRPDREREPRSPLSLAPDRPRRARRRRVHRPVAQERGYAAGAEGRQGQGRRS